jgi:hypothetical protein
MPWLILVFLMAAGGGYAYHTATVAKLESAVVQLEANNRTLKENQVQMELAVQTAQESLKAAEAQAKAQGEAMNKLTLKNNELAKDKANAMKIFKDHNLTRLARAKPGMIEKRANLTRLARAKPGMIEKRANAKTAKVFRELENDTKELMDADDSEPTSSGLPVAPEVSGGSNSSGTTDNNGN